MYENFMKPKLTIKYVIDRACPTRPTKEFRLSPEAVKRLRTVGDVLLVTFVTAGIITLSAAAPNIFQAFKTIQKISRHLSRIKHSPVHENQFSRMMSKSISHYVRKGYIKLIPQGNDYLVEVTEAGKKQAQVYNMQTLQLTRRGVWKGGWWMTLADIPTELNDEASYFRKKIKELGLYRCQKSVWLYPYDIRSEIQFVAAYYGVDRYITIIQVVALEPEDQQKAKQFFKDSRVL